MRSSLSYDLPVCLKLVCASIDYSDAFHAKTKRIQKINITFNASIRRNGAVTTDKTIASREKLLNFSGKAKTDLSELSCGICPDRIALSSFKWAIHFY